VNKLLPAKKTAIPWYLYMLKTAKGSLYTGITVDVVRRFNEHSAQSSKTAKSLRGKGPLSLAYCVILNSHTEALQAELWIKKQARANKLKLVSMALNLPFQHQHVPLPLAEHKNITEQ
jgi:putative endonuclease